MAIIEQICKGLSIGIILGFLLGGLKAYSNKGQRIKNITAAKKFTRQSSIVLKYITFLLLLLGMVWCSYFLILGCIDSSQSEYANNMSELIVSVLTVISIMFAFVEFLKRTDDQESKNS